MESLKVMPVRYVRTISRSKQAPIHMSEIGLETLALLIGPKRAFHIALAQTKTDEKVGFKQILMPCELSKCTVPGGGGT